MEFTWGTKADHRACLEIAAASPEHFHADALPRIRADMATESVFIARHGGSVLGFAVVRRDGFQVAEILWMAIDRQKRCRGIGTELCRHLDAALRADGVSLLVAKTLASTSGDSACVGTRRFYERAGFLLVDSVDPYPGWNPGNPCAIYAKPLGRGGDACGADAGPGGADEAADPMRRAQTGPVTVFPPASAADRRWLIAFWRERWTGEAMVTRGRVHRLQEATALLARDDTGNVGAVAYRLDLDTASCEVLSLDAKVPGRGVGGMLLTGVEERVHSHGCRKVWLVTSNDNLNALRFYQRRGYRLVTVHVGAVDEARRLKPSIPLRGYGGIPLHDEIELAKWL